MKIIKYQYLPSDPASLFGKIIVETDMGTFAAVLDSIGEPATWVKISTEEEVIQSLKEFLEGSMSLSQMKKVIDKSVKKIDYGT